MIEFLDLVTLLDTLAFDTAPPARRLIELLEKRGRTTLERVDPPRGAAGTRQDDTAV
ncbi:hypothetical protein [Streptomyces sp. NPDC015125]|uniref:hypothetical protein n=1 Tax=Streptomyces sp. NPDC015125 TaxID=3364938 RepID=UPI0036FBFDA1